MGSRFIWHLRHVDRKSEISIGYSIILHNYIIFLTVEASGNRRYGAVASPALLHTISPAWCSTRPNTSSAPWESERDNLIFAIGEEICRLFIIKLISKFDGA